MPNLDEIKKEIKWLACGFVILTILLIIAFQNTGWGQLARTAFAFFWMFVIPGYALMLCSRQGFVERFIIGLAVQTAVIGLASYYVGLMGWHVATQGLVLPLFSIAVGLILWWKNK